jgi:hypothetical protein
MKVLPDGFELLLAPAAALPAVPLIPPLVGVPVVVPFVEAPVVTPDVADPPVAGLPPAEPLLWANAKELASASAAARVMVMSLMVVSNLVADQRQTTTPLSPFPLFLKPTQT